MCNSVLFHHITLCRPTECYLRLRKHYVGRQSTLSGWSKHCDGRQSALSGWSKHCDGRQSAIPEWSKHRDGRQSAIPDWSKHRDGRQSAIPDWSKHRDGRQSVISNCASILSAVRVLHPNRDSSCRKWTWQITQKISELQQKTNASILPIRNNYYLCPR